MAVITQKQLRLNNIRNILKYLTRSKNTTKQEISRDLNLSFATVSGIIEELSEYGLITTREQGDSTGGRKPNLISLIPESKYSVAVDLSPRNGADIYILDFLMNVTAHSRCDIENTDIPETILEQLKKSVFKLQDAEKIPPEKILGIGIALPAIYDREKDMVIECTKKSLNNINIRQRFERLFGPEYPIIINNDATMAVAGYREESVRKEDNLLFLNFAQGIGLGMIINKQEYLGADGFAGEPGNILISHKSLSGPCRFEDAATVSSIVKRYLNQEQPLTHKQQKDGLAKLIAALEANDDEALQLICDAGEIIGTVVAMLEDLFNPNQIIISGDLLIFDSYITPCIQKTAREISLIAGKTDLNIETSNHLKDFISKGCGIKVFQNWLKHLDHNNLKPQQQEA